MTQFKPYLFINRVVISSKSGKIAYDEKFHRGVNIIRGRNSSGKSTVANFIFFGLGGDFTNWTSEALKCDSVFLEISINDSVLTLKRIASLVAKQSMSIFWGNYETAIESYPNGWKTFPYSKTESLESISSVLFGSLGYPEVKTDNDFSITMHQLLRLIYIDQDSPTQNLFRLERFDPPLLKQAISELLLGVYDDTLYHDRIELRNVVKQHQEKKNQFDHIRKIFNATDNEIDAKKIDKEIQKIRVDLDELQLSIIQTRDGRFKARNKNAPLKIESLNDELSTIKKKINQTKSEIDEYEVEVLDSKLFIDSLEKRIVDLENSMLTRRVLGELPLTNCPQCLSPLDNHVQDDHCVLCKQPLLNNDEKTHALRLKQEIEFQVNESKQLLMEKERALSELNYVLPPLLEKARSLQRNIDLEQKEVKTSRDEKLDELFNTKGALENKIEVLTKQLKTVEILSLLGKEIIDLSKKMEGLKLSIASRTEQQEKKLNEGLSKIKHHSSAMLRKDLDRQPEFKTAQNIELDFSRDYFTLNGNNNFSASANTYFKNAVRYSIFFSSLDLEYFRFPRLIICDNMEDKGMEPIRSQNFQKIIVDLSLSYDIEHQIIFTTSMINPELNNSPYCVGAEYSETQKTLKT